MKPMELGRGRWRGLSSGLCWDRARVWVWELVRPRLPFVVDFERWRRLDEARALGCLSRNVMWMWRDERESVPGLALRAGGSPGPGLGGGVAAALVGGLGAGALPGLALGLGPGPCRASGAAAVLGDGLGSEAGAALVGALVADRNGDPGAGSALVAGRGTDWRTGTGGLPGLEGGRRVQEQLPQGGEGGAYRADLVRLGRGSLRPPPPRGPRQQPRLCVARPGRRVEHGSLGL